jgi:hypothetical protein
LTILLGCDFTSAPSRRKPVVLAVGRSDRGRVLLERIETFETLDAWQARLTDRPDGGWVGGFDLPFGLPRELVETLGWPTDWRACMAHYAACRANRSATPSPPSATRVRPAASSPTGPPTARPGRARA